MELEGRRDEQKYVPDYTMINHFKELLYDDEITLNFGQQKTARGTLDYPITPEELKTATKILKNGKGIGVELPWYFAHVMPWQIISHYH